MIRGIHHVTIHVRDFDRMKRFYIEAMGFHAVDDGSGWDHSPEIDEIVGVPQSAARSIMLSAGNCFLEMFQYSAPVPDDRAVPLRPHDHGYTHFCLDVTDIDTVVEHLAKHGMSFDRGGRQGSAVDVGVVKAIYGRDPEGNLIEIQETLPGCTFGAEKLAKASLVS